MGAKLPQIRRDRSTDGLWRRSALTGREGRPTFASDAPEDSTSLPDLASPPTPDCLMRVIHVLATTVLLAAPHAGSPTSPVGAQELTRPVEWQVRLDDPAATEAELEMFVSMPPGWHITTGPAGIFWDPALEADGAFRAEMEVFLFDPEERREGFGVFVGGSALAEPGQSYTYFLIRDGGEFLIKRRQGDETREIVGWTRHEAIRSYTDRGEDASVRNVLAVEARRDRVRFLVNGREVTTLPRSELSVEGTVGLRVNHRLNLHVSRLEVTPLG